MSLALIAPALAACVTSVPEPVGVGVAAASSAAGPPESEAPITPPTPPPSSAHTRHRHATFQNSLLPPDFFGFFSRAGGGSGV